MQHAPCRIALVGLGEDALAQIARVLDEHYELDCFATSLQYLHDLPACTQRPSRGLGWAAVVCGLDMPGISGLALLHQTRLVAPAAQVVVICRDQDEELTEDLRALGAAAVLQEPVAPESLGEIIDGITAGASGPQRSQSHLHRGCKRRW
jgi:DNA-binding NarL/FixJ family response regulator